MTSARVRDQRALETRCPYWLARRVDKTMGLKLDFHYSNNYLSAALGVQSATEYLITWQECQKYSIVLGWHCSRFVRVDFIFVGMTYFLVLSAELWDNMERSRDTQKRFFQHCLKHFSRVSRLLFQVSALRTIKRSVGTFRNLHELMMNLRAGIVDIKHTIEIADSGKRRRSYWRCYQF